MSIFNKVPVRRPKRTPHRLNNSVKFSTQFGFEVPTVCRKVIPGDILSWQHAHRIDFAPLSTKLLQEFRVKSESFFIPTRIMWKGFEEFFVEEENEIIHPFFTVTSLIDVLEDSYVSLFGALSDPITPLIDEKSLLRSLYGRLYAIFNGTRIVTSAKFDVLRVFAYFRVFAEYYLDENLQKDLIDLLDVERFKRYYENNAGDMSSWLADTYVDIMSYHAFGMSYSDALSAGKIIKDNAAIMRFYLRGFLFRNYPKDYFTSALPWKQKGNTVMIPQLSGQDVNAFIQNEDGVVYPTTPGFLNGWLGVQQNSSQSPETPDGYTHVTLSQGVIQDSDVTNQYIRLRTAAGAGVTSIEDFRTAYQLQQWLEKNARGGTRYKEQILSHFGIKTKDSRLDRPEFLLGTTDVIAHGDVFTTFQNEDGDGVPAESVTRLSGAGRSMNVTYKVFEHGYFINLFCLFPKASYNLGVYREALELDKFDYFWPEFQHLGEQEIFNSEVDIRHSVGSDTFGYTPRYAQYKCAMNDVFGDFSQSLLTFTDSRMWNEPLHLSAQFIRVDPLVNNLNRIFNVVTSDYDKIYVDFYNNLFMVRPMDYYGIPRLVL